MSEDVKVDVEETPVVESAEETPDEETPAEEPAVDQDVPAEETVE